MGKSYRHHKGGEKKGGFFNFRHDIFESAAYRDMRPNARSALNEIIKRFNGFNNGYISFSVREMAQRLNVSPDTAGKAITSVKEHGFIKVTEDSGFNVKDRKARRFALTFEIIEIKGNGHKITPTNEWRKWKPPLDNKIKIQSGIKDT